MVTHIDNITRFLSKPCRFKMQDGREVFGVLWREVFAGEDQYYFASTLAYKKYLKALEDNNIELSDSLRTVVDVRKFASARLLTDRTEAA